jgi:hypothetical protein
MSKMSVVRMPQVDDILPRSIRIVLAADPVVLFVARKRQLGSLLRTNEPLVVVGGRIDEVSDYLLWRPLPRGAWLIRLAI